MEHMEHREKLIFFARVVRRFLWGVVATGSLIVLDLPTTLAQEPISYINVTTKIDVPSGGLFGSGEPSVEIKQKARAEGRIKAWMEYKMLNTSGALSHFYVQHEKALLEKLESGSLCTFTYTDEEFDKVRATFRVTTSAQCDRQRINTELANLGLQSGGAVTATKGKFTFVFFVRRAEDEKEFLEKEKSTKAVTATTTGAEVSADSSQSTQRATLSSSQDSASVTQSIKTETKGTIERRDTRYVYVVEQSEAVDNAVTSVLTTGGFTVSNYSDVAETCPGVKIEEIIPYFEKPAQNQGELIPANLRNRMFNAARQCEYHFFAIGLLDILKAQESNKRAEVTVAFTIDTRDIRAKVPVKVAAIPVSQYRQLGNDRLEATNKALNLAATRGIQDLVDILSKQKIQ